MKWMWFIFHSRRVIFSEICADEMHNEAKKEREREAQRKENRRAGRDMIITIYMKWKLIE